MSAYYDRERRTTYRIPTYRKVRSPHHRMHFGYLAAALAILTVLAGLAIWFYQYQFGSEHHEVFTITRLDDQSNGSSHKYLVFARLPDGTTKVYEDTDAWFHGKTNSSDLYGSLTVGETVNCDVYGYRIHLTSGYQNLLGCKQVTP